MSERLPDGDPILYTATVQGREYDLTEENTSLFLHRFTPEYDHIYIHIYDEEHDIEQPLWLWRANYEEEPDKFNEMVHNLKHIGCPEPMPSLETVSDFDKNAYIKTFGHEALPLQKPPEPPETLQWISRRRELEIARRIAYLIYLAEHGLISEEGDIEL